MVRRPETQGFQLQTHILRSVGKADGTFDQKSEDKQYVPGASIRGAFRDGAYARRRSASKAHAIVGLVGLALVVVVLVYIAKFYALL